MLPTFRPFLHVMLLSAAFLFVPLSVSSAMSIHPTAPSPDIAAGRKTVTVFANNATEAVARAEKANRGWKALSAKKVNKNPKSRAWRVTMTKK